MRDVQKNFHSQLWEPWDTLSRGFSLVPAPCSGVVYPPSPPIYQHRREWSAKGAERPAALRRLALGRPPRLCYFHAARRGYILQSLPRP